ncbi:hypothetical protein B296_00000479 [Ensete ventricosum]|uniref:Uncharacterized protein n=1 Tax=Ensete ventricosum TaxID=4639 RepID=A0A427A2D1_ENSVE|nr:hypothetical protein B296_00000479 [Ensete ventricosum]
MPAAVVVRLRGCRWYRLQQGCGCNRRKMGPRFVQLLQRKIAAGSFLPQGSLLAMIKEGGSERSLLAALGSERCVL